MKVVCVGCVPIVASVQLQDIPLGESFRHPNGSDTYVKCELYDGYQERYLPFSLRGKILTINLNNNRLYWYEPGKRVVLVDAELHLMGDRREV